MKNTECSNCGKDAQVVRGDYHFKESGLRNLVLTGIELIRCGHCGNVDPILSNVDDLMYSIAQSVIRKPSRLVGEELRFLRKHLELTQDQFAEMLRIDKTTLSKWENEDDPIGWQSELLIRMVAQTLLENHKSEAEKLVHSFGQIEEKRKRTQIKIDSKTHEYEYA
jgi:putative zinc finger/helix-turn-helix YgiT family protein